MIRKFKKPRYFKGTRAEYLSIHYYNQKNPGWNKKYSKSVLKQKINEGDNVNENKITEIVTPTTQDSNV